MTGNEYAQANVRAASAVLTCRISESYWRRTNWLNSESESVDALLIAWFLSDCVVQMVFYMRAVFIHRNLFISVHWSFLTYFSSYVIMNNHHHSNLTHSWKLVKILHLVKFILRHKAQTFFKSLVMCVSYLFILETLQNLCVEVSQSYTVRLQYLNVLKDMSLPFNFSSATFLIDSTIMAVVLL